jgi:type I restriction enzyme S subunit
MVSEWPTVRLGDHVDSSLGKMLDANKNKGTLAPYLGNSNVRWGQFDLADLAQMKFESHEAERYGIREGDLIVCEGGEPGRCAIWREQIPGMKIQKALHRVRAKPSLSNRYLFYWFMLAGRTGQLEPYFTGTTIKHLTGKALAELKVQLPPIAEQRAIAATLGALDDRIDNLRETNATLEAIAAALFKSWFEDFDGVSATDMQESELGLIPKEWRVGSVYDIAEVRYGAPFSSSKFNTVGDGFPLVRIRDLRNEKPGVWTPEVHPKGYLIQPGDIIVGMDGEFRAYLWGGELAWMNQRICAFHPKSPYCAAFVHNVIAPNLARVEETEVATTVIHLGKSDIDEFRVIIPSDEVAAKFEVHCQPLYDRIVTGKQQAATLAALRDTLLPRLISGQLRVNQ